MNINDESIQIKKLMKHMRNGCIDESTTIKIEKNLTVKDMLKITRKLNEDNQPNKKTVYDQGIEEEKFRNFFNNMPVSVKFVDLEVYNNLIFWGGTVDGIIQFVFRVTPDEETSGVRFNYLEDFSPDNPQNEELVKKIESYYDVFYKYWRDNIISSNNNKDENN